VGDELLTRALSCAPGLAFFVRRNDSLDREAIDLALLNAAAINVARELGRYPATGSKFKRHVEGMLAGLASTSPKDSKPFERGLDSLGRLLGFDVIERSQEPEQKAIPDSIWSLENRLIVGWEAKSGDSSTGPIPIEDVRQARLHVDWIGGVLTQAKGAQIDIIFSSPRSSIDPEARKFAARLRYMKPADVCSFAERVASLLAKVRNDTCGGSQEVVAEAIQREFQRAGILPQLLASRLPLLTSLPDPFAR
jgi:hypothetical protein